MAEPSSVREGWHKRPKGVGLLLLAWGRIATHKSETSPALHTGFDGDLVSNSQASNVAQNTSLLFICCFLDGALVVAAQTDDHSLWSMLCLRLRHVVLSLWVTILERGVSLRTSSHSWLCLTTRVIWADMMSCCITDWQSGSLRVELGRDFLLKIFHRS